MSEVRAIVSLILVSMSVHFRDPDIKAKVGANRQKRRETVGGYRPDRRHAKQLL